MQRISVIILTFMVKFWRLTALSFTISEIRRQGNNSKIPFSSFSYVNKLAVSVHNFTHINTNQTTHCSYKRKIELLL